MALQFILGASGSGKSDYIYNRIIDESLSNPKRNYILLVPEQYSMVLQRKMVRLHPNMGTTNIDVIGFNRLTYRVFDELMIKPDKVLEDFGKTMLIRQVAGKLRDELSVYGSCLDKNGFIDEVKSLMSELYQYDVDRDALSEAMQTLRTDGENRLLLSKLEDMLTIFKAFDAELEDKYIVAEQLTELLAMNIDRSDLVKNSVIIMDGFTGFTPIQLKIIRKLLCNAVDVYVTLTIDKKYYAKKHVANHELFYLTRQTMDALKRLCDSCNVELLEDIFLDNSGNGRWKEDCGDLVFLEENIFRYPYGRYAGEPENISIALYDNPQTELAGIAEGIVRLVREENYRYKDIAVICGNLDAMSEHIKHIFSRYDIPVFLDSNIPLKNNACLDSIGHALRIVEDNFSYDSVFAFLKSGVVGTLTIDDVELLENYVLEKGIRGFGKWNRSWPDEVEETRKTVLEILTPFRDMIKSRKNKTVQYTAAIRMLMETLDYEAILSENMRILEGLVSVLDKLDIIMPEEELTVDEFKEIFDVGLKDISLGMIPAGIDMVVVGDITRTRLDDIKALFIMGMNDGIIPKQGSNTQIISDLEKEELAKLGVELAPTERQNSYIEQFYLYNNMTKPSHKLYLSYTGRTEGGEPVRPSYIISRVLKIFPDLIINNKRGQIEVTTKAGTIDSLITGVRELMDGNTSNINKTLSLYKLYNDVGDRELLDRLNSAFCYSNIPKNLTSEVAKLVELKTMSQSVSRIEKFANCAYSYFLRYTLGLRERNSNELDSREIGTVLHGAMEKLYVHVRDNLDNDWAGLETEKRDELVNRYIYNTFDERHDSEGRNEYLRELLARIARRTAKILCDITVRDGLSPSYFEYNFERELPLYDGKHKIRINGIVDRGDVIYSEEENKIKLRIIDYKSSNHEFDICKLYDGVSLQLAVYMYVMKELVGDSKAVKLGATLVPEGMYYYHLSDPYVEAKDEQDADRQREKELKLKGIDYSEPVKFDDAVSFAVRKVKEIAQEMLDGKIDKNPFMNGDKTSCDYCEFKDVCRFDDKCGGNKYHYPAFTKKEKDKAFEKIRQELGGDEDGMD